MKSTTWRLALVLPVALAVAAGLAVPAVARDRNEDRFDQYVASAFPLSFRSERGGRFQPDRIVLLTAEGSRWAVLPSHVRTRSADHLDLSGMPGFGQFFQQRIAPQDAERKGTPVGVVSRIGDTLVVDARATGVPVADRPLVLATDLPRFGGVTFEVGLPRWQPGQPPGAAGPRVGSAWLLDGRLVLASDGGRPLITDWSRPFGN